MIILKTTHEAICGGNTSNNWGGSSKYLNDTDAFVFSMKQKYSTNNSNHAIFDEFEGFCFGKDILSVSGTKLNETNNGGC